MNKKLLLSLLAIVFSSLSLSYSQNLTCGSNFYDPSGPNASYLNNSNVTTVINPTNAGENVTVTFSQFQLENNFDLLKVYNGLSSSAPLLATLTGSTLPNSITASNSSGSLTFVFTSDSSVVLAGWSAVISCAPVPIITCPSPVSPIATLDTIGNVTFSWNETGNANNWEVYVSPCGTTPTATTTGVGSSNNSYTFQGLSLGTCYSFFVRSICGPNDFSNWSSGNSITIPVCEIPTQLSSNNISTNSANFYWISNSTQNFEYFLTPVGGSAPTVNTVPTGLVYTNISTVTGLTPDVCYTYYVRSVCSQTSKSEWSNGLNFCTTPIPIIPECGGYFYDNGGFNSNYLNNTNSVTTICPSIPGEAVTVTFTSFNIENNFDGLYVYDGNSTTAPQISSTNTGGNIPGNLSGSFWGTSIPGPFTSTSPDGCLTFKFISDSSVNNPGWTSSVSCDIISNCPKPANLVATPTSLTSATVSWNQTGTAAQWEIQTISNGVVTSAISASNPYIFSNLVEGQVYLINVRAICNASEQSNWATYTLSMPSCITPTVLNTTNVSPYQATINWNSTSNLNLYNVLVLPAGSSAPTATEVGISTTTTYYNATGLTSNTTYDFYVKSACQFNTYSNWSTVYSFTTPLVSSLLVSNTTQFTPQQLVNTILVNNPCISASNITWSTGTNFGSVNGIGYFTNTNPTFPMTSGLILSTGNAANANGPNTTTLSEGSTTWTGDSDLEAIITATTGQAMNSKNATKLEFDFTTVNEFMSFNFLFASEEYGTFQCTYSDAFAFLLTDQITGVTSNIAVVPGTTTPISVVTIRDIQNNASCASVNSGYFDSFTAPPSSASYLSPTNFNGQTVKMTASSALIPNHPYHIKLVVADRADALFDSAVFIEAGTFASGPPQCYDKIQLVAFVDSNNNGTKDAGENDFSYGSFTVDQNNSGIIDNISSPIGTYVVFDSNPSNVYDFGYAINAEFLPYYSIPTINYNDISIALGSGTQTFYFPVTLTQGYNDVTVSISPVVPPRPGFGYTNKIVYKNLGINATSGTLNFVKDVNVSIASISQTGVVQNPSGFSFDFNNLQPYESRWMYVTMNVPAVPTVNLTDILTDSATISAPANDINSSNNSFINSEVVVASYDPNDITEAHGGKILYSQFTINDYLYYTIRFQNTGTANAVNVKLENILDSQFDPSSIRMVSASHDYIMERIGNQLTFKFNYINLVGALQNEMLSKGYVTYKIKLNPGFTVGTIIPNTASIYFDTNPAIVTNTFNTEFVTTLANASFDGSNFVLYPNPATSFVDLSLKNSNENLEAITIYDVVGKTVKQISKLTVNQIRVDTSEFSNGMYFVEITTQNKQKLVKKLVVK